MKKSDLNIGNVVELRNGFKFLFLGKDKELIELTGIGCTAIDYYHENLTRITQDENYDIMKVYKDYTCKELLWERKEKPQPKLTEDEKVILRNLPKKYEWIARDKCGTICTFIDKPHKNGVGWSGNFFGVLVLFEHLFQFIQWEDEEPYSIEELLGEEK